MQAKGTTLNRKKSKNLADLRYNIEIEISPKMWQVKNNNETEISPQTLKTTLRKKENQKKKHKHRKKSRKRGGLNKH